MIKANYFKYILILPLLFIASFLYAKATANVNKTESKSNNNLMMDCAPGTAKTTLEINNVKAHLRTTGTIFFRDELSPPEAGYEVPKGNGTYSIYAGALWIGALDDDNNLKLAAQTYRLQGTTQVDDFWPGPLGDNGETTKDICNEYDRFWHITKEEVDAFVSDFEDGSIDEELSDDFTSWKGPFVDADGDNIYDPEKGDYPKINGDEAIWSVINDKGNMHTKTFNVDTTTMPFSATSSLPLGIEIQTLVYGFNTNELANITFMDYTLINRSSENLKKAYLGTWIDPDLGNYEDDFVGCDTLRNLGICYNGDPEDEDNMDGTKGYGTNPPFVAIQILNGIQTNSGNKLDMSGFVYYNNDGSNPVQGDPQTAEEHYNYLTGRWKDGSAITFGGTGLNPDSEDEVTYMFPSNPSDEEGWSECAEGNTPADRRFIMATGPFDMQPGASKKMTQSVLWIRPPGAFDDGCPTFDGIQDLADDVLLFYSENLAGDDVPPVITIDGEDFFTLDLGADWSPPTATAVDNEDGEVEVIIDDSNLNLEANGYYDVIYTAVDSNGNSSERIVTVLVGTGVGVYDHLLEAATVYPNPVIDVAHFQLNNVQADAIQLFDLNGKLVVDKAINSAYTFSIDVSTLKSGVYLYQITKDSKVSALNKLVKR